MISIFGLRRIFQKDLSGFLCVTLLFSMDSFSLRILFVFVVMLEIFIGFDSMESRKHLLIKKL